MKNRPGHPTTTFSTPSAHNLSRILRPIFSGPVAFTVDEVAAFRRLYDVPRRPAKDKPTKEEQQIAAFEKAGDERNLFRHVDADGLRLMAVVAKHLSPGEDPVRFLLCLLAQAGHDVDPEDLAWAQNEDEETDGVAEGA